MQLQISIQVSLAPLVETTNKHIVYIIYRPSTSHNQFMHIIIIYIYYIIRHRILQTIMMIEPVDTTVLIFTCLMIYDHKNSIYANPVCVINNKSDLILPVGPKCRRDLIALLTMSADMTSYS